MATPKSLLSHWHTIQNCGWLLYSLASTQLLSAAKILNFCWGVCLCVCLYVLNDLVFVSYSLLPWISFRILAFSQIERYYTINICNEKLSILEKSVYSVCIRRQNSYLLLSKAVIDSVQIYDSIESSKEKRQFLYAIALKYIQIWRGKTQKKNKNDCKIFIYDADYSIIIERVHFEYSCGLIDIIHSQQFDSNFDKKKINNRNNKW